MNTIAQAPVTFKEILIASDLSDASASALDYTKALVRRFGAHMMLVHVSEPLARIEVPEGAWVEDNCARDAEEVETIGDALRAEGLSVSAVNAVGSVRQEIVEIINNSPADLVVLGTHARSGMNRFILGSYAEDVARRVSCPVLIVGPSAAPVPSESWLPKNIVCATSLDPDRVQTVSYAVALAKSFGSRLTIVTVVDSKHPQSYEPFEEALAGELSNEAVTYVKITDGASNGDPGLKIADVARASKADLLVMGAKQSHWGTSHLFPGVLAQVLAVAPCPVLTAGHTESS